MIEEKKRQEEEGKRGAWNEVEIGEYYFCVCGGGGGGGGGCTHVSVYVKCILLKRVTFLMLILIIYLSFKVLRNAFT
jgi:hypothetical protein